MEQAGGLALFARLARQQKDINIICFTGYRFERLINDPPNQGVSALLSELDVLIDGPYIQEKNNSIGLRGSTNQRVIHLTSRLRDFVFETQSRRIEFYVSDGELQMIGIPTPEMKNAFDQAIKAGTERIGLS
jgi:anaerobic ribonucleoside-triphosphate reductase activating protein